MMPGLSFDSVTVDHIPADELALTPGMIARRMGYDRIPQHLQAVMEEQLADLGVLMNMRAGYRLLEPSSVRMEAEQVICENVSLRTGAIIGRGLRDCAGVGIFVTTAGAELGDAVNRLFDSGDPLGGFVLDTIGSEAVEAAVNLLERRLADRVHPVGWKLSNRYSPGYCGWDVSEQHQLFSLLPKDFCGVTLTDAALMVPVKSASGIWGIGPKAEKREYECRLCDREECVIRHEEL